MKFHSQDQESRERDAQGSDEFHRMVKWDRRFLALAQQVASWSKDPSTKTGAVIVRPDNSIASLGYNGFPKRTSDAPEQYENRELKYSKIVHCEMNALLSARERVDGYTLYTWPFLTCDRCAAHVIQAGIGRVVAPECPDHLKERWAATFEKAKAYYAEAGIQVVTYV
jgi:dCMP deaminase